MVVLSALSERIGALRAPKERLVRFESAHTISAVAAPSELRNTSFGTPFARLAVPHDEYPSPHFAQKNTLLALNEV